MKLRPACIAIFITAAALAHAEAPKAADAKATKIINPEPPAEVKTDTILSVIRVNVTNQPWDFGRPWGKRPPYSRRAIGAVLPGGRVLVTAELVTNANYVEFETASGGQKVPAAVDTVDYECNLALLKTEDPEFLRRLKPLEVAASAVGDQLSVWQLESNGNLLVTKGALTTAEVSRYPLDDSPYLIYRVTAPLQFRDSSFTLPVVKEGALTGIVMRYDANTSNADLIPAPVIQHFLKDAANPPYKGFPRAGMAFSMTRDPQFRRYLGLSGTDLGGIYVNEVIAGGPADKAGIEAGDIITKVDGKTVEKSGDLPRMIGNTKPGTKITVQVFRRGSTKDIGVTVAEFEPDRPARRASDPASAPVQKSALGLTVTDLGDAQKREMRLRGGVRVEAVDGAAARAGLREGDVILSMDNTEITDVKQFNQLAQKAEKAKAVSVLVRRGEAVNYLVIKPSR